jgi:hypothetical protein
MYLSDGFPPHQKEGRTRKSTAPWSEGVRDRSGGWRFSVEIHSAHAIPTQLCRSLMSFALSRGGRLPQQLRSESFSRSRCPAGLNSTCRNITAVILVSAAGFEPATHALKGLSELLYYAVPACVCMYLWSQAICGTGQNMPELVTFSVTFWRVSSLVFCEQFRGMNFKRRRQA